MIIPSVLLVKSDGSQGSSTSDGKAQPILSGLLEKPSPTPNVTTAVPTVVRPPTSQPLTAPRLSSSITIRAPPRGRPPKQISIPSVSQLEKVITDSIQRGVDVSPKNFPSFTPLNSEGATSSSSVQTYVGALTHQVTSFMKELPEATSPPPQVLSNDGYDSEMVVEVSSKDQASVDVAVNVSRAAAEGSDTESTRRRAVAPSSAAVLVLPKPLEMASETRNSSNPHQSILLQGRLVTADTSGKLLTSAPYSQTLKPISITDESMDVEDGGCVDTPEEEAPPDAISIPSSSPRSTAEDLDLTASDTPMEAIPSRPKNDVMFGSESALAGTADVNPRQSRRLAAAAANRMENEEEEEPPPEYEDLTKDDAPDVFIDLTKPELSKTHGATSVPVSTHPDDCPMPRRNPLPAAKSQSLKATPLCRSSLRPNIRAQKKSLLIPKSRSILKPTPVVSRTTQESGDVASSDRISVDSEKSADDSRQASCSDVCDPAIEKAGSTLLEPQKLDATVSSATSIDVVDVNRESESDSSAVANETRTSSRGRVPKPSRRSSATKIIARKVPVPAAVSTVTPMDQGEAVSADEIAQPSSSRVMRASRPSIPPNVPKKSSPPPLREEVESTFPVVDLASESSGTDVVSADEKRLAVVEATPSSSDRSLQCIGSVIILPKNLQCPQCSYKTHTQKFLDLHIKSHKIISCNTCLRTFADEVSLRDHKLADHSQNSAETLYECPRCEYKTRHQVYISRHMTLKHAVD